MWNLDQTYETSAGTVRAGAAGRGPPLVLAHGWPWSSRAWHRVVPVLAGNYRVHWYDMPGFGRSQMDGPRQASLDTQGEVFGEMLDHWSLDAPSVVAHDLGGAVTLRAHLLHDRDYARLVLMNVVAMRPWGSKFFDHVGRHLDAFTALPAHVHTGVIRAYVGGALIRPIPDDDFDALVAPWLDDLGRTAFYAQFAMADEHLTAEMEPSYDSIRCPVAILWGEDDPWIPISRGHALGSAVGSDLTVLPGLGHLPQIEDSATVATALRSALEGA